ncbi:hypothetical protein [Sinorhizobium medicae]|uniref:ATP dependent DNA ligase n=1 Tax=Sinorhizobium medicae TaxID=110321 RepID=UPI001F416886|nr:hypothetical protein [Sinorhizobium medicae]
MRRLLKAIPTEKPVVALKRKGAIFTKPLFVAEVRYRAWTHDGKLRHPSFKGIRQAEDELANYELAYEPSSRPV